MQANTNVNNAPSLVLHFIYIEPQNYFVLGLNNNNKKKNNKDNNNIPRKHDIRELQKDSY
jgi:hypothetical protein